MELERIVRLCQRLLACYERDHLRLHMQRLALGKHAGWPRIQNADMGLFRASLAEVEQVLLRSELNSHHFSSDELKFLERSQGLDKVGLPLLVTTRRLLHPYEAGDEAALPAFAEFKEQFDHFYKTVQRTVDTLGGLVDPPSQETGAALVHIYYPSGVIGNSVSAVNAELRRYETYFGLVEEAIGCRGHGSSLVALRQGSIEVAISVAAAVGAVVATCVERIFKLHLDYLDIRAKSAQRRVSEERDFRGRPMGKSRATAIETLVSIADLLNTALPDDVDSKDIVSSIKAKFQEKLDVEIEKEIGLLIDQIMQASDEGDAARANELSSAMSKFLHFAASRLTDGATIAVALPKVPDSSVAQSRFVASVGYENVRIGSAIMSQYRLLTAGKPSLPAGLLPKPTPPEAPSH